VPVASRDLQAGGDEVMASFWRAAEIGIAIASAAMLTASVLAIPWFVRRVPADYFARPPRRRSIAVVILRNLVAVAVLALGVAMLVLPGQGILTIIVGLSLLDLPVKYRVLRWLLDRRSIRNGVQRIRTEAGKPPLVIPGGA
jgi:putative transmembrane protein PGPGW